MHSTYFQYYLSTVCLNCPWGLPQLYLETKITAQGHLEARGTSLWGTEMEVYLGRLRRFLQG